MSRASLISYPAFIDLMYGLGLGRFSISGLTALLLMIHDSHSGTWSVWHCELRWFTVSALVNWIYLLLRHSDSFVTWSVCLVTSESKGGVCISVFQRGHIASTFRQVHITLMIFWVHAPLTFTNECLLTIFAGSRAFHRRLWIYPLILHCSFLGRTNGGCRSFKRILERSICNLRRDQLGE